MALIKAPDCSERRIATSFLYPLWDTPGLISMVLLPPILTLVSIFTVVIWVFWSRSWMRPLAFPLLPFLLGFLSFYLYVAQTLTTYLQASAWGEVLHPRWPELNLANQGRELARWLMAIGTGALLGLLPAVGLTRLVDVPVIQTVVLAMGVWITTTLALFSILASVLYDDVRAGNPITSILAIARVGLPAIWPGVVAGTLATLSIGLVYAASRVTAGLASLLTLWLIWVFVVYAGLVSMRVLGVCYDRHRDRLDWFPERERWGVRG